MKTRMPNNTAVAAPKGLSPLDWEKLYQKVLARARLLKNDRVARALEAAHASNTLSQCLKKMSILSEVDLNRELPLPKP
jgi:hypothetical protein